VGRLRAPVVPAKEPVCIAQLAEEVPPHHPGVVGASAVVCDIDLEMDAALKHVGEGTRIKALPFETPTDNITVFGRTKDGATFYLVHDAAAESRKAFVQIHRGPNVGVFQVPPMWSELG
jgi:hypothetical protein